MASGAMLSVLAVLMMVAIKINIINETFIIK